jgi:hypothetical protein
MSSSPNFYYLCSKCFLFFRRIRKPPRDGFLATIKCFTFYTIRKLTFSARNGCHLCNLLATVIEFLAMSGLQEAMRQRPSLKRENLLLEYKSDWPDSLYDIEMKSPTYGMICHLISQPLEDTPAMRECLRPGSYTFRSIDRISIVTTDNRLCRGDYRTGFVKNKI